MNDDSTPRPLFEPYTSAQEREAKLKAMRAWCEKRNDGGHRKLPGSRTCLDCATDLDQ